MHIKHIALKVKTLERSVQFYETITELKGARRFNAGPSEVAFMENNKGETEIELIYTPQSKTFERKGLFICFETDKLDKMHQLAQNNGLNPSPIQYPDDETRYFYVYDPDGVSVQLRTFPN